MTLRGSKGRPWGAWVGAGHQHGEETSCESLGLDAWLGQK